MGFKIKVRKVYYAMTFLLLWLFSAERVAAAGNIGSRGAATGDYSNFVPWVALAVISLAGITVQLVLLRRSKDKREKGKKGNGKKRK